MYNSDNINLPIYADNNATTQLDPEVFEAMKPYFIERFGNASSKGHSFGWEAEKASELARKQVADLINADSSEIIFTSGATESVNLVHFGIMESYFNKGNKIITTEIEHSAVIDSLSALERKGCEIIYLKHNSDGEIDLAELKNHIDDKVILVSIMTANNEIGVVNDIDKIGAICKEKEVFFHTDATQAVGNIPFDVRKNNADLVSFSGHKFYGPKGTGALYINKTRKINIAPRNFGGGQERGIRPGTFNTPGIVGIGKASEIAKRDMTVNSAKIQSLRNKLLDGLIQIEDIKINGSMISRTPGNLNVSFKFLKSENIIMNLREIAISSGSACASASLKPSRILKALGVNDDYIRSAIRFGIGKFNNENEINYIIKRVTETVSKLRSESPEYLLAHN